MYLNISASLKRCKTANNNIKCRQYITTMLQAMFINLMVNKIDIFFKKLVIVSRFLLYNFTSNTSTKLNSKN